MIQKTKETETEIEGRDAMTGDVIRVYLEDGQVFIHHNDVEHNPCKVSSAFGLHALLDATGKPQVTSLGEFAFILGAMNQLQPFL